MLTKQSLAGFTGTTTWYRHWMHSLITYTDGVKYMADEGGAHWLIDEIVFAQAKVEVAKEDFQSWMLVVHTNGSATLTCTDGDENVVFTKQISYTDFPLPDIILYYANKTLYLPSEH